MIRAGYLFSIVFILTLFSCKEQTEISLEDIPTKISVEANERQMWTLMEKHLQAVSQKDLVTLKTTMSPRGDMQLILPASEIINGVDGFMDYHQEWFAVDNSWTFETKILNTKTGDTFGMAIVEIVYREPERDGVPYFIE